MPLSCVIVVVSTCAVDVETKCVADEGVFVDIGAVVAVVDDVVDVVLGVDVDVVIDAAAADDDDDDGDDAGMTVRKNIFSTV